MRKGEKGRFLEDFVWLGVVRAWSKEEKGGEVGGGRFHGQGSELTGKSNDGQEPPQRRNEDRQGKLTLV